MLKLSPSFLLLLKAKEEGVTTGTMPGGGSTADSCGGGKVKRCAEACEGRFVIRSMADKWWLRGASGR